MRAIVYDRRNTSEALLLLVMAKHAPSEGQVLEKIFNASIIAADYRSTSKGT